MLRIVLIIGVTTLMYLALCGCTESATQWEHQRQSEERQRESDRDLAHVELDVLSPLEKRVRALEDRVEALEKK